MGPLERTLDWQNRKAAARDQPGQEFIVDRGFELLAKAAELERRLAPEHSLAAGAGVGIGEIEQPGKDGRRVFHPAIAGPAPGPVDQGEICRYVHDVRLTIEQRDLGTQARGQADIVRILLADILATRKREAAVERPRHADI